MSTILIIIALYYLIRNVRGAIISGMESRQRVQTSTPRPVQRSVQTQTSLSRPTQTREPYTSSRRVTTVVTEEMDESDQREMKGSFQGRNESQEQHGFIADLEDDHGKEHEGITFDQARQGMIWSIIYGPPRAHRSLSSERLHP
ncbi:hypothetical protein [Rubeoparvulum massiliense]|uniref:hypothetical protein n=1 Tax=Rubeoparvulum massiliense TaxID=1631346 RepID=UPI0011CBD2AC|nr:hypothetical protein [Rubeoparvulum massiliense]